jgi:hypothetical protein
MDIAQLTSPSWQAWKTLLRAVFVLGVPSGNHLLRFRRHTGRQDPPTKQPSEVWITAGRRAGKTKVASLVAAFLGVLFDSSVLSRGETAVVAVLAADRRQARVCLSYLRALFELPLLTPFVSKSNRDGVTLKIGCVVEIHTSSFRTIRGYTMVGCICDEIAYWHDESGGSANPDSEIVAAIRPSLATVPGSLLFAISSPHSRRGELFTTYQRSWGKPDEHTMVWCSDSLSLNPTLPRRVVEQAFQRDPIVAASEWGTGGFVQFRRDIESYVDPAAIEAVTVAGRFELPPLPDVTYHGFTDPSGGSQDSFTLAVAHREGDEQATLDLLRETRPPFDPTSVVEQYATLLKSYGCFTVTGDRYAGEWPREAFRNFGIAYEPSSKTKSDLYRELLPSINASRVELLDLPALRTQLCNLERRVARSGKDSIDHGPGGRDDVANSAAGALIAALPSTPARRPYKYQCRWA